MHAWVFDSNGHKAFGMMISSILNVEALSDELKDK